MRPVPSCGNSSVAGRKPTAWAYPQRLKAGHRGALGGLPEGKSSPHMYCIYPQVHARNTVRAKIFNM